MRRLLACFLLVALIASAANVEFVRVWPEWRSADAFDHIGQYFGHDENEGRDTILRTLPTAREGLYFLVRVKTDAVIENAKFVLEVIRPDNPEAKTFSFPVAVPAKGRLFELGLTGADWPGGRAAHPVAWKVTLLDGGGQVVGTKQSFLWELPAK